MGCVTWTHTRFGRLANFIRWIKREAVVNRLSAAPLGRIGWADQWAGDCAPVLTTLTAWAALHWKETATKTRRAPPHIRRCKRQPKQNAILFERLLPNLLIRPTDAILSRTYSVLGAGSRDLRQGLAAHVIENGIGLVD